MKLGSLPILGNDSFGLKYSVDDPMRSTDPSVEQVAIPVRYSLNSAPTVCGTELRSAEPSMFGVLRFDRESQWQ